MTTPPARLLTLVSFGNLSSTSTASTTASERPEPRLRSAIAAACALLLLLGAVCVPAHAQPNWVQESPSASPPARDYAALAYDAAHGQVVLFGGGGEPGGVCCGYFNDTWVWDGTNWTQEFPADSPSARATFGMAYDAAQGQVVLFGGGVGGGLLNDTWVWDGTNWTQEFPANSPSARSDFDMAYDTVHSQVVLFGGLSGSDFLGDTWVWDGTNWTQLSPATSPPARAESPMAYDAALGQAVLFGGSNGGGTPLNDTWVWDGTNWTQADPANSPSGRVWADMAYDPQQSRVVLFGGLNLDFFNDTWVYEPQLAASPSPLTFPNIVPDESFPKVVVATNAGLSKLTIGTVTIMPTGGDLNAFTIKQYCHQPRTLRPGQTCTIRVLFRPHEFGLSTATLNIPFDGPGSPLEVSIAGTGVARKKEH